MTAILILQGWVDHPLIQGLLRDAAWSIAIGAVLVLALAAGVVYLIHRRRRG